MSENTCACEHCCGHQAGKSPGDANVAYTERNKLVAALSKLFPSHLMLHPEDPNWDPQWRNIVCINGEHGQMTWHIHDRELPLFAHLEFKPNNWDGHSTELKYERLERLEPQTLSERYHIQADESRRVQRWHATYNAAISCNIGTTYPADVQRTALEKHILAQAQANFLHGPLTKDKP